MKKLTIAGWLAFVVIVALFAWQRTQSKPTGDCQHYDSLGRGIGCEGNDLGDM
jgi:uncharacterized sodium:solute symporter family permease YidK